MRDPSQDPERRHQSRAWKLMEALEAAPFGNESRLEIIQGFLDEERAGAVRECDEACGVLH
jgi:hypothetical protein